MDTAGKSLGDRRPLLYLRLLTHRVSDPLAQICFHSSPIHRFGHSAQPPTAGFRFKHSPSNGGLGTEESRHVRGDFFSWSAQSRPAGGVRRDTMAAEPGLTEWLARCPGVPIRPN